MTSGFGVTWQYQSWLSSGFLLHFHVGQFLSAELNWAPLALLVDVRGVGGAVKTQGVSFIISLLSDQERQTHLIFTLPDGAAAALPGCTVPLIELTPPLGSACLLFSSPSFFFFISLLLPFSLSSSLAKGELGDWTRAMGEKWFISGHFQGRVMNKFTGR